MADNAAYLSMPSQSGWTDRLLRLALLAFSCFAWLPDSYFRMMSWPWVLVWQGGFGLVIALCLWRLRRADQPLYCLGFGLDWLILGLLGCLVVSSLTSFFPLLALQNSLLVVCYVLLLYCLRNSGLRPLQLCQGAVWVGAIAAIISLIMWQPTPDMWLSDNFYEAIRNRFPLGHHNFTGGYFVLVLPVAIGLAWLYRGRRRWVYGALSLPITAALYASGSRGAWLGGVCLLVVVLAYGIVQSKGRARLGAFAVSGVAICLVFVLLGSNPRIRSLVSVGPWRATVASSGGVADGPTLDRLFMAQASLNILKDRPLGLGPGNLGRVYERYRPLAAGAGLSQVQQLHNMPLQLVVELGIGGAVLYLGLLVCLVSLIGQLQTLSSAQERRLSLSVAMALLGYGVSSLSDYQLENIPIAVTLTVFIASLTQLGNDGLILQKTKRWGSLLLLTLGVVLIQFWLRSTLSLWMTHQGLTSIHRGNLMQADDKFYTAALLTPWDPTPKALAAQQLSELAKTTTDDSQDILQTEAIERYQQALHTAPNDIWFNQNLAVLAWKTEDITTAHRAITKVVQLSPRSKNYSYYLLGLTYQQMGNINAAIEALALDGLINPNVLLFSSWQHELSDLREAVFERVLEHCQTIVSGLAADDPLRASLNGHIDVLRWWADLQPVSDAADQSRLLIQALLAAQTTPEQATGLLDRCIAEIPSDASRCRLLKAWLQPEYLTAYLTTANLDAEEEAALRSHITTHRDLKQWLQSTTTPVSANQRVALALLYRSYYAQQISSILIPDNLQLFSLPVSLQLFTLPWPREYPPLDNLLETVRAETLGLPHPTQNRFEFTVPQESPQS